MLRQTYFLFMEEVEFKAQGYLKKTYLDKEGAKQVTFEFSAKDAVEIAKLELMGRDLNNHMPVLLEVTVKEALTEGLVNARPDKPKQVIR